MNQIIEVTLSKKRSMNQQMRLEDFAVTFTSNTSFESDSLGNLGFQAELNYEQMNKLGSHGSGAFSNL